MPNRSNHPQSPLSDLWGAWLIVLLGLGGCQFQSLQEQPPISQTTPSSPIPVEAAEEFLIDSEGSEMRIYIFREGPLVAFGHNHVILAEGLNGAIYLTPDFYSSGFSFSIPLDELKVDPLEPRRQEGPEFTSDVSEQARQLTRENMLGEDVLDAQNFPEIVVRSISLVGPKWQPDVTFRINLRGFERELTVPISVEYSDDTIVASGEFEILQSEFGILPYSVLGGGLQVSDKIRIKFRILARS